MSLFAREVVSWAILIAIIWDTVLTAVLLLMFRGIKRRIGILEAKGIIDETSGLD